jgi:Asp/Glu/hydantoin racemase
MKKTNTHFLKTVEAENGFEASVDACFSTGGAMRAATECLCAPVVGVRGAFGGFSGHLRTMA